MCVVILAWQVHPNFPLILISNRDEYYGRNTLPAAPWEDDTNIIAGRDMQRNGTWLGVTHNGRVAVVTCYRDGPETISPRSRGLLTTEFLQSTKSAQDYLKDIPSEEYAGYNLIVGHVKSGLWWGSNRGDRHLPIEPGIHGLSNHLLNSPWPKVQESKQLMESLLLDKEKALDESELVEELFKILTNPKQANDEKLPNTGIDKEWEKALSSMFVAVDNYGTRASSVLLADRSGAVKFVERSFGPDRKFLGQVEHHLSVS